MKETTNVYLCERLSFFNRRRNNSELLMFISKFRAAWSRQSFQMIPRHFCRERLRHDTESENLISQLLIIQGELVHQRRERLVSAVSLRNIPLQNYSSNMLKTRRQTCTTRHACR